MTWYGNTRPQSVHGLSSLRPRNQAERPRSERCGLRGTSLPCRRSYRSWSYSRRQTLQIEWTPSLRPGFLLKSERHFTRPHRGQGFTTLIVRTFDIKINSRHHKFARPEPGFPISLGERRRPAFHRMTDLGLVARMIELSPTRSAVHHPHAVNSTGVSRELASWLQRPTSRT